MPHDGSGALAELGHPLVDEAAAALELAFELCDLGPAGGEELELAVDVDAGLVEDLAPSALGRVRCVQLVAQVLAGLLGLEELLELGERDAQEAAQAHGLLQP